MPLGVSPGLAPITRGPVTPASTSGTRPCPLPPAPRPGAGRAQAQPRSETRVGRRGRRLQAARLALGLTGPSEAGALVTPGPSEQRPRRLLPSEPGTGDGIGRPLPVTETAVSARHRGCRGPCGASPPSAALLPFTCTVCTPREDPAAWGRGRGRGPRLPASSTVRKPNPGGRTAVTPEDLGLSPGGAGRPCPY